MLIGDFKCLLKTLNLHKSKKQDKSHEMEEEKNNEFPISSKKLDLNEIWTIIKDKKSDNNLKIPN